MVFRHLGQSAAVTGKTLTIGRIYRFVNKSSTFKDILAGGDVIFTLAGNESFIYTPDVSRVLSTNNEVFFQEVEIEHRVQRGGRYID